jgi:hypothetical protein
MFKVIFGTVEWPRFREAGRDSTPGALLPSNGEPGSLQGLDHTAMGHAPGQATHRAVTSTSTSSASV